MNDIKYYEFNVEGCYAMIKGESVEKVLELYINEVLENKVEKLKEYVLPTVISKYDAFVKYCSASKRYPIIHFEDALLEFESEDEHVLLIDDNLILKTAYSGKE